MTEYSNNCYIKFTFFVKKGSSKENNLQIKYFYLAKIEGKNEGMWRYSCYAY